MSPSSGIVAVKAADPVISHTLIQLQEDVDGGYDTGSFFFFFLIQCTCLISWYSQKWQHFSLDYTVC